MIVCCFVLGGFFCNAVCIDLLHCQLGTLQSPMPSPSPSFSSVRDLLDFFTITLPSHFTFDHQKRRRQKGVFATIRVHFHTVCALPFSLHAVWPRQKSHCFAGDLNLWFFYCPRKQWKEEFERIRGEVSEGSPQDVVCFVLFCHNFPSLFCVLM